jgi:hypothetical protein
LNERRLTFLNKWEEKQEILSFEKSIFCTDVEFLLTGLFLFNQDFRIDNVSYLVMKTYQKVSIKFF